MRSRRGLLGWTLAGMAASYALAWIGVGLTMARLTPTARAETKASPRTDATAGAAHLVRTGTADARTATRRSLAVGPPTPEQLSFMRGLDDHQVSRPSRTVVALGRVADPPRRLWSRPRN